ncbi:MAG: 4Fe-4S binding protein [Gammaproteobacteria bacterium]|nr:4Fe-4S binding protein [Gammaproteobacteria bacterium]MBT8063784.1 4Fe-4S binding protein [Gammaproteobacteria bacterium]
MRKPAFLQPRILKQAVLAAFSRPYTTKFPAEPFEPQDAFRGRPRFDADGCIGCGACAQVCPPKCIEVIDDCESDPPTRRLVQHFDACIMCGQCERYCPTQRGIRMTTEWDTAGFRPEDFEERVERELVLCEVCGDVVAPAAQLDWLVDRLGPAAFANPTLAFYRGKALGYTERGVKSESDVPLRQDRMAIQCPRCRRQTAWAA